MQNRCRTNELGLAFVGVDPPDYTDARDPGSIAEGNLGDAVRDHGSPSAAFAKHFQHRLAACDHRSSSPADASTGESECQALLYVAVRVKQHRDPSARNQRGRRKQARAVHVDEVRPARQIADDAPLLPEVGAETQEIPEALIAGSIGTAIDVRNRETARAKSVDQRAIARQRNLNAPASLTRRTRRIEQYSLRSAQLTKLIEEQNPHAAKASTKQYTGRTRQ